jgi:hypothetical protein
MNVSFNYISASYKWSLGILAMSGNWRVLSQGFKDTMIRGGVLVLINSAVTLDVLTAMA